MAVVQLRDIVTDEDRARALAVQRGPGQEHYVASVEKSFADANELYTSCVPGDGTPQPFYERYGFVPTGRIEEDEVVLRLDLPRGDR